MLDLTLPPAQAALINLGGSPLIGLVVLVIVVGIVAWLALKLISFIPMASPFKEIATWLVYAIAILIVVAEIAKVVFGVVLF
jgi:hypothetical protein